MVVYLIAIITFFLITNGVFRISMAIFSLPDTKVYKITGKVAKVNQGTSTFELLVNQVSAYFADKLKLSEVTKERYLTWFRYSDKSMSPEFYVANKIVRSILLALPALILYFIFQVGALVCFALSLIYFFKSDSILKKKYMEKKQEIEWELPRFCATINQEIKNNHDVIGILERYAKSSDKGLRKELEITIADMKSSNYEAALVRLESRLSLGSLSDIVRGLIGVIRGDDMVSYFEILSHDLDALELQRLEDRAAKQPNKIKKYQFIILATMMIVYIVIIAVYIIGLDKSALMN